MFKLILSTIIMTIVLSTSYFSNPSFAESYKRETFQCRSVGYRGHAVECAGQVYERIQNFCEVFPDKPECVQPKADEPSKKIRDEYVPLPEPELCSVGYLKCIDAKVDGLGGDGSNICRCLHFKDHGGNISMTQISYCAPLKSHTQKLLKHECRYEAPKNEDYKRIPGSNG